MQTSHFQAITSNQCNDTTYVLNLDLILQPTGTLTMGCKNRSTQSPNSKHFHFEPSFYKLAACHVKTVNLRRAVGCEPCLFVSHFLLFVNFSTPRLLNGPFYSAFLKVSNNIYCLAGTYVYFANCYFLLSKLIFGICCDI